MAEKENQFDYQEDDATSDFMISFMETPINHERYIPFLGRFTKNRSAKVYRLLIGALGLPILLMLLLAFVYGLTSKVSGGRAVIPMILTTIVVIWGGRLYLIPYNRGTTIGKYISDFTSYFKRFSGTDLTKQVKVDNNGLWRLADGRIGFPFFLEGFFSQIMLDSDAVFGKQMIGQQRQFLEDFEEISLSKISETTFKTNKDHLVEITKSGDKSSKRLAKLYHSQFMREMKSDTVKRHIVIFVAPKEESIQDLEDYLDALQNQGIITFLQSLNKHESLEVLDEL